VASRQITQTLKSGNTSDDRALITDQSQATSPPRASSDAVSLNFAAFIHLFFVASASFEVQVWWYSAISGAWHQGELLSITENDLFMIETRGLERLALQVTSGVGGAGSLKAWAAAVVDR